MLTASSRLSAHARAVVGLAVAFWFLLLLVQPMVVGAQSSSSSLADLLRSQDELSIFTSTLERTGLLNGILSQTDDKDYTVLAPSNTAIAKSRLFQRYMHGMDKNPPPWKYHLLHAAQHHILPDVSLNSTELFDQKYNVHPSLEGPIRVTSSFGKLGGSGIFTPDLKASNGYVHIMDEVIDAPFFEHSFAAITEQPEFGPDIPQGRESLKTIVDFVDGYYVYDRVYEGGQTHVGCRIRALNLIGLFYLPQCINGAPDTEIKFGEFLNETWKNRTISDFLEYTLIPERNFYNADIPNRYQELIMGGADECSHMWVTKSEKGKLCFNDGCVVDEPVSREYLANNGYGYVVDKCIVCSGVSMLINYAAEYTSHKMQDHAQFMIASEWNLRNLSRSVGNGEKVTLLATSDSGWSIVSQEDVVRLTTDKWKPHQWDLLLHNILQGEYLEADFIRLWNENGKKPYNLTTLAGQNVSFDFAPDPDPNSKGKVMVNGGHLWYPDIKGVDGYVIIVVVGVAG